MGQAGGRENGGSGNRPGAGGKRRPSVRRSLLLVMVGLAFVPVLAGSVVLGLRARALVRAEVRKHMTSVATNVAAELARTAREHSDRLYRFTRDATFRAEVAKVCTSRASGEGGQGKLRADLASLLGRFTTTSGGESGLAAIVPLGGGRPLVWTRALDSAEAQSLAAESFTRDLPRHTVPWLSGVHWDQAKRHAVLDLVQVLPAADGSGAAPVAAVVWRLRLEEAFYPVLDRFPSMGETSEIVLVDGQGLVLRDLRYEPGTVLRKVITTPAVTAAIHGEYGLMEQDDYRPRPVVAAYSQVPGLGWGVVAKTDTAEAYAGIVRLQQWWALMVAVLAGIAVVASRAVAARVVRPVLELSEAAQRVAEGELGARVEVRRGDELGDMARDFNAMAEAIGESQAQLQAALLEAQTARGNLSTLISCSPVGIYVCDRDQGIVVWNPAAERILGWAESDVLGLHCPPSVQEDALEAFRKVTDAALSGGVTAAAVERKRRHKNGSLVDVSLSVAPLPGANGQVSGFMVVIADIAERLRADREHEERTALEQLVDITHRMLAEGSPEDLLQRAVEGVRELTGAEVAMTGHGYRDGVFQVGAVAAAGDSALCQPGTSFSMERGGVYQLLLEGSPSIRLSEEELRQHPRSTGLPEHHVPLRGLVGARLSDADGVTNGLLMASRKDAGQFTPRDEAMLAQLASLASLGLRHLELGRTLARRVAELGVANQELESFSYSVSHDLRAPLRAIDGFGQALLEDYSACLDEEGRHFLQRMRAASQQMGELIDDLLHLARVTREEMRYEAVDLTRLAHLAGKQLMDDSPAQDMVFEVEEGMVVTGDPRLLKVALANLLGNSWKFTSKLDHAVVRVGTETLDGERVFYVRDNGAGFDMSYADKLFTPFQRLHSQGEYPGNGIGLAIVQRVVHRHDGRVWAEGSVGGGATVSFTLPH